MPEEVSNPDGLSGNALEDPAMIAAAYEGRDLKDKLVLDVNGLSMGKVARAFAEDGSLLRFDVHLTRQAKQLFGVAGERALAGVPVDAIAQVDENTVRLKQAAEQILHPDAPWPGGVEPDQRGAKDLPRKNR